ncbi:RNA polymerase II subunit A C-terminal domain phosphatase [Acrasis kona]|uniref:protein-serine/threonine phosphatase n=1 Tax=Acrasis kona TaxID=1008807 RepID=A0AAW2YXK9_9EUKA
MVLSHLTPNYCAHDLTYRGLCTSCGQDIADICKRAPSKYESASTEQLGISLDWIAPGVCGLQANNRDIMLEIFKQDYKAMRRSGKLRLVLDMDETMLHSIKTPLNGQNIIPPNGHNRFSFCTSQSSAFTVFLRPHLFDFLQNVGKLYEIYIYTNGTDRYAKTIYQHLQALNPSCNIQAIFTKAVRGRTTAKKQLHKMLCKRSMSLIVDDKPEVWCEEDSSNIIPITPFRCQIDDFVNSQSNVYMDEELLSLQDYLIRLHGKYIKMLKWNKQVDVRDVLKQYSTQCMDNVTDDDSDMEGDDEMYESDVSDDEDEEDEDEDDDENDCNNN